MTDVPLDDQLLALLRADRPEVDPGELAPDSPAATALLEAILAGRASATGSTGPRAPLVLLPPPAPAPPLAPRTRGRGRGYRRAVLVALGAAVLVLGTLMGVSAATGGGSHREGPVRGQPGAITGGGTPGAPVWRLEVQISPAAWKVASSSASGAPYGLTCPSAATCYASGPSGPAGSQDLVEVTHDGGASWQGALVAPAGETIGRVTCPRPATCMVAGVKAAGSLQIEQMYTTTDGGASWSARPIPTVAVSSPQLSCWTPSDCLVVETGPGPGGIGLRSIAQVTHDDGRTWSGSVLPGTFRIAALTCGPGGDCVATGIEPPSYRVTSPVGLHADGAVLTTTDGGRSWTKSVVPPGGGMIGSVSCAGQELCVALQYQTGLLRAGSRILVSTDGGRRWSSTAGAGADILLSSVSCPTTQDCRAAGFVASVAGGAGGTGVFVERAAVVATTDGARTWHEEALPPAGGASLLVARAISCAEPATCLALAEPKLGVAPTAARAVVLRLSPGPAASSGTRPTAPPA